VSLIAALLAVIVPVAAGFIAKELGLANGVINKLPAPFPALIAVVVAYLASVASQALGIVLPGDLAGFDQNVIASALSVLVSLITHTSVALKAHRASRGLAN
jgi:hypothetical protein